MVSQPNNSNFASLGLRHIHSRGELMERSPGRRHFLKSVTALTAAGLPAASPADESRSPNANHFAQAKSSAPLATQTQAYVYLTQPEAAFLEAAVSRLIPADELGPGAKEA